MIMYAGIAIACFLLGYFTCINQGMNKIPDESEIDIWAENRKLRKENQFLWKRLSKYEEIHKD